VLNLLKHVFSNIIKKEAEKGMENAINNAIDRKLNDFLQTLPYNTPLRDGVSIDYSIVTKEVFASSYMTFNAKGEFYVTAHRTPSPFTPHPYPDADPSHPRMMQLLVSDYVPNTAAWAYWKAGVLQITVTQKQIPPDSPLQFNTSSWKSIIPQLYTKYPNWGMKATLYPIVPPTTTFTTAGAHVVGSLGVDFFVVSSAGAALPVFTVGVNYTAQVTAQVKGNNITGAISQFNSVVYVVKSEIGTFDSKQLQGLILFFTEVVAMPLINSRLGIGFPIPTFDGITLVNPVVGYGDHFLFIDADGKYTPPASLLTELPDIYYST